MFGFKTSVKNEAMYYRHRLYLLIILARFRKQFLVLIKTNPCLRDAYIIFTEQLVTANGGYGKLPAWMLKYVNAPRMRLRNDSATWKEVKNGLSDGCNWPFTYVWRGVYKF